MATHDEQAATALRPNLPPLPPRWSSLPIDRRGYPVPYFVAWVNGEPDHRIADAAKMPGAIRDRLCWMCGHPLTSVFNSFCIGPMCCITRTIAEPPSHIECLRFSVQACPWITRPKAKRREANLPDGIEEPGGFGIRRNPGAVCLWTTRKFRAYRNDPRLGGNEGILFSLGDPSSVEWWAEGRPATREEVAESVRTGLPLLIKEAEADDAHNDALAPPALMFGSRRRKGAAQAELFTRIRAFEAMIDRYFDASADGGQR